MVAKRLAGAAAVAVLIGFSFAVATRPAGDEGPRAYARRQLDGNVTGLQARRACYTQELTGTYPTTSSRP